MKIVVASRNPVKIAAVERAFGLQFPSEIPELLAMDVESGVSEQPMSDEETRCGALNRVRNARASVPDADYWVGLEGGIEDVDGELLAFAWMAVADPSGRTGEARSPTLPLPPAIGKLVAAGMELGDANDQVFATVNSKQGGGAFGLLTNGLYTRESIYTQTVVLALIPLVHELWSGSGGVGGRREAP